MLPDNVQEALQSDEVRDEIIKEFAREFISLHPNEVYTMNEAINALMETLSEFSVKVIDFVKAFCQAHSEMQQIIQSYPNKKVKHLAVYGRTERIRKKNTNRILREFENKVN